VAEEHPGKVIPWGVERGPYRRDMRRVMYDELRTELGPDDWFMQIDADEFIDSDPRPTLARAASGGCDLVRTWQAQFQFTDVDLAAWEAGQDDRSRSICERRRHYMVDWREDRFFRNRPDRPWEGTDQNLPTFTTKTARTTLVNRHYQYRDPEQMQRRLEVRAAARTEIAFTHVTSTDWRSDVVPTKGLRTWEPGKAISPRPWRYYARRWGAFSR
jgi:hypothetical protein